MTETTHRLAMALVPAVRRQLVRQLYDRDRVHEGSELTLLEQLHVLLAIHARARAESALRAEDPGERNPLLTAGDHYENELYGTCNDFANDLLGGPP